MRWSSSSRHAALGVWSLDSDALIWESSEVHPTKSPFGTNDQWKPELKTGGVAAQELLSCRRASDVQERRVESRESRADEPCQARAFAEAQLAPTPCPDVGHPRKPVPSRWASAGPPTHSPGSPGALLHAPVVALIAHLPKARKRQPTLVPFFVTHALIISTTGSVAYRLFCAPARFLSCATPTLSIRPETPPDDAPPTETLSHQLSCYWIDFNLIDTDDIRRSNRGPLLPAKRYTEVAVEELPQIAIWTSSLGKVAEGEGCRDFPGWLLADESSSWRTLLVSSIDMLLRYRRINLFSDE